MEAQTKTALLPSPLIPVTLIITVFSAWLSETTLRSNFTLSPARPVYRNSHSHFADRKSKSRDCLLHNLPSKF